MKKLIILIAAIFVVATPSADAKKRENFDHFLSALAMIRGEEKDVKKIMEHINTQIEITPLLSDAYYLRSTLQVGDNNYVNALRDVTKAIDMVRSNEGVCAMFTVSDYYEWRAVLYVHLDEYKNALADYNEAVRLCPKDKPSSLANLYYRRGEVHEQLDKYVSALIDAQRSLDLEPTSISAMLLKARALFSMSEYEEGLAVVDKVLTYEPGNAEAYRIKTLVYCLADEAKTAIDSAIQYIHYCDKPDEDIYADAFKMNLPYAIEQVTKILEAGGPLYWHYVRMDLYFQNEEYVLALKESKIIEPMYENSMETLYVFRGLFYASLEMYDEALDNVSKALDITPRNAALYKLRANLYTNMHKLTNALANFERAVMLDPSQVDYQHERFNVELYLHYQKFGVRSSEGDEQCRASLMNLVSRINGIIEQGGENGYVLIYRGSFYRRLGDEVRAKADFEKALTLDVEPNANSQRALALVRLGRYEEARAWAERVIILNEGDSGAYYNAACLYSLLGDKDMALHYLEQALRNGHTSWAHIEFDPDLANIHKDPRFRELLDKYHDIELKKIKSRQIAEPIQHTPAKAQKANQNC